MKILVLLLIQCILLIFLSDSFKINLSKYYYIFKYFKDFIISKLFKK